MRRRKDRADTAAISLEGTDPDLCWVTGGRDMAGSMQRRKCREGQGFDDCLNLGCGSDGNQS